MHDPLTVAFEIKNPFKKEQGQFHYKPSLLTIWHRDPESDGSDDSCQWFLRKVDQAMLDKVVKEFAFNFKHNYWFAEDGFQQFSTIGVVMNMYTAASWQVFMHMNGDKPDRGRHSRFMHKYLYEIIHFAENPTDSLTSRITKEMYYRTVEHDRSLVLSRDERIHELAAIITGDIVRKLRPWYKHPRWHIHHWRFQFHPLQQLKRRYWDKCSVCGKRGFKGSAIGDWNGSRIWHQECDQSTKMAPTKAE